MTYVVTENCIKCKYTDCVEICPVDCFYEHEHMLAINPDECIDCGICEPECPADAIKADSAPDMARWLNLNALLAADGTQITKRKEPPPDADRWLGVAGKYQLAFGAVPAAEPATD